MKKQLLIFLLLLASSVMIIKAQSIDKIINTPPSKLVNDYTNVLTASQQSELENKVVQYDKTTSTQIAIVIVKTVEGRDIADVGTELLRKWGIGGSKNNNGVVIVVAYDDRKMNISTGYGLEKSLPDITCQQIIDYTIRPNFKGSDYYRGLDEGVDAIIQATQGEYKAPAGYGKKKHLSPGTIGFIIILIIIFISLFGGGGGRGGSFMSRRGYRGFNGPFIFPTGGWGGGGSGGGWSGGGGGFGGFGGGSGGGGGASGSW